MRRLLPLLALVVIAGPAAPAGATAPPPLHGPDGVSQDKVLVIGTDGTRWDLVRRAMREGRAPNLRRLIARGFGTSTLLPYAPPRAFTMSAVGWTTIATGVGPAKHGVHTITNTDPEQATKHGYEDFLTRLEDARPRLSTFMVGDWGNLGLPMNGGPIFGDRIDVKYDTDAGLTAAEYDREDARDTRLAAGYLRHGNPDAGFVYLGVVDETAHNYGSATAAYRDAIARTDARIGRILRAVRSRATYGQEHWTIIVTTDHGQRNLSVGSLLSHGFGSKLERTSFIVAAGPGLPGRARPATAGVVDINPTVLHQMGVPIKRAWRLDGHSLARGGLPPDVVAGLGGSVARPSLTLIARRGRGGPPLRSLRLTLPAGLRVRNGRTVAGRAFAPHKPRVSLRVTGHGRRVTVDLAPGARRLRLVAPAGALRAGPAVRRALRRGRAVTVRAVVRGVRGAPTVLHVRAAR